MKRFRVLTIDFDSRPGTLTLEIGADWEPRVKEQHQRNKTIVLQGLIAQYGSSYFEAKVRNFTDLGSLPLSVVSFHNRFHAQARDAFVVGAYYPALTGICALGERVLNHLLLGLRDSYRSTPEFKAIHRKKSFEDWDQMVATLEAWNVLLAPAAEKFRELKRLRHQSVHFRPEVDTNDRQLALDAIRCFSAIVQEQFGALGRHPWFIPHIRGASYLKKGWESNPFIKLVYLPSCAKVGPYHRLEGAPGSFRVVEPIPYPEGEISDEEFAQRVEAGPTAIESVV